MAHNDVVGHGEVDGFIQLPTPTIWPLIFALGVALAMTGLVTHWAITALGICLILPGIAGWFVQIFPHEQHEPVAVSAEVVTVSSARAVQTRPRPKQATHGRRGVSPLEGYSLLVGVKGGLAGGVAMTVPAAIFGLLAYHSVWYPINLLAAGGFVSWAGESDAFLAQFHLEGLLAATGIHLLTSVLVGLLYGAMLPMFPRKPILTCGFIAPFLWTGILYSTLGVLSPILDERIHWAWFFVSQIAFGLVAGYVVNLSVRVRSAEFQSLPFAVRAGLHTDQPAMPDEKDQGRMRMFRSSHFYRTLLAAFVSAILIAGSGCKAPGKPGPEPEVPRPENVLDFKTLYGQNCVACHGDNQHPGPAITIANPVYLAVAGESTIVNVLDHGVPGKLMPAFGQSGGGMLTEQQVGILAKGLISTWGQPGILNGLNAPPYKAALTPNVANGQKVFAASCASCHGDNGQGADVKGALFDPAFLALISDQNIRSIVISGLPRGMPNFHEQDAEHPLTDQNVTDVVAFVASHRTSNPPATAPGPAKESRYPQVDASKVKNAPSSIR